MIVVLLESRVRFKSGSPFGIRGARCMITVAHEHWHPPKSLRAPALRCSQRHAAPRTCRLLQPRPPQAVRQMRIALVSRWYPPHTGYGGVSVYHYFLARALVRLGHEVTVVAARWSADVPAMADDGGVVVHRLLTQHRRRLHRLPIAGRYVRPLRNLLYGRQVAKKLRELEIRQAPNVVEFADVEAEGFAYLLGPRRIPVSIRCHTPTFVLRKYYTRVETPHDTALTSAMERYCIRAADSLNAPSVDMARTISAECGIPLERISVFPNALDLDCFFSTSPDHADTDAQRVAVKADELVLLHVGRLERAKGAETLAAAIPTVLEKEPRALFVSMGEDRPDGRGSSWCRRLSSELKRKGMGDRALFLGEVPQKELLAWYRRAQLAVVPSMLYESFSYTCAQALAAGLPVVASRIGGVPETVDDGINGILVPPGDASELSRAILHLASDPALRDRMGKAGRAKAQQFGAERVATRFVDVASAICRR